MSERESVGVVYVVMSDADDRREIEGVYTDPDAARAHAAELHYGGVEAQYVDGSGDASPDAFRAFMRGGTATTVPLGPCFDLPASSSGPVSEPGVYLHASGYGRTEIEAVADLVSVLAFAHERVDVDLAELRAETARRDRERDERIAAHAREQALRAAPRCAVCGQRVFLVDNRAPEARLCGHHSAAVLGPS